MGYIQRKNFKSFINLQFLTGLSLVFLIGFSASLGHAQAIERHCALGETLNDCVADVCSSPEGGTVYLAEGEYDGRITDLSVASCVVDLTVIGAGIDKTILISNQPSPLPGGAPALAIGAPFAGIPQGTFGNFAVRDFTARCTNAPFNCPFAAIGASNNKSFSAENIKAEGFFVGVFFASDNVIIENLQTRAVVSGIYAQNQFNPEAVYNNIRVENSSFSNSFTGVTFVNATNLVIERNAFESNVNEGVFLAGVMGGNIESNYFCENGNGITIGDFGSGPTTDLNIEFNVFNGTLFEVFNFVTENIANIDTQGNEINPDAGCSD